MRTSMPYHTPPLQRNRAPGEPQTGGIAERRSQSREGQPGGRVRTQLRLRLALSGPPAREADEIRDLLASDLSTGGVFVSCQDPPQLGERALIEVHRPGGGLAFAAKGRVVWRRPAADRLGRPPGFGLAFDRLDVRSNHVISGLIDFFQRQRLLVEMEQPQDGRGRRPGADRLQPDVWLYSLDDIVREVTDHLHLDLPASLFGALQGEEAGRGGDSFLWRWAYEGVSIATLSCVDPALGTRVRRIKMMLVMLSAMLDDASGRSADECAQSSLFDELSQVVLRGNGKADPAGGTCLDFARRVFQELQGELAGLPRHPEFEGLLRFDLSQLIQGVRYQRLMRQAPHLVSEDEIQSLFLSGLPLRLGGSVDLCASPSFDVRETGLLREVLGRAQRMAYTGHLLMNWERQCQAGDLSSGVVAYGLSSGTLSIVDLDPVTGPLRGAQLVGRLREARVDSHFLTEWLRDRYTVRELAGRLRTVEISRLLQAHQQLTWLQFQGKGLV